VSSKRDMTQNKNIVFLMKRIRMKKSLTKKIRKKKVKKAPKKNIRKKTKLNKANIAKEEFPRYPKTLKISESQQEEITVSIISSFQG